MAGDANNIIVGAAQISINGVDVGFTQDGTTVRYEPEFLEVMADQAVGVVRRARTLERLFVVFTLLEVTLERIRQAFMLPTANLSGNTLTLGYNNACWVDEVALTLIGVGPSCGVRTFSFGKAVSFGTKEYNMQRDEQTAFEVEFEVLKDATGNFGTIVDS